MYEWQLIKLVLIIQLIGFLLDFNNGVILQWGQFTAITGDYNAVSLPTTYTTSNYTSVISTLWYLDAKGAYGAAPGSISEFQYKYVTGTYQEAPSFFLTCGY